MMNRKGFTLIELLVVIAVIALLFWGGVGLYKLGARNALKKVARGELVVSMKTEVVNEVEVKTNRTCVVVENGIVPRNVVGPVTNIYSL